MDKWIQNALKKHKKGALHRELHIPLGKRIPESELREIVKAHIGNKVEHVKVTRLLKERAVLAENLRKLSHKK